jgi:hypothetical protein
MKVRRAGESWTYIYAVPGFAFLNFRGTLFCILPPE